MNVNVTVDTYEQSQVLVAFGQSSERSLEYNYKEKKMAEPIVRCLSFDWKPFVLRLLIKKTIVFLQLAL